MTSGIFKLFDGSKQRRNSAKAQFAADALREFAPHDDFLSLLNLGDGTTIVAKWGAALKGRSLIRLRDRIDRFAMEKYE